MIHRLESFEAWARRHQLSECYCVTNEPSSHGLETGWQVTIWESGQRWFASRQVLSFFTESERLVSGFPLNAARARDIVRLIDSVGFWNEDSWPNRPTPDGNDVLFDGFRRGQTSRRVAHSPCEVADERPWLLLKAFGSIRPNRFLWWRRRVLR